MIAALLFLALVLTAFVFLSSARFLTRALAVKLFFDVLALTWISFEGAGSKGELRTLSLFSVVMGLFFILLVCLWGVGEKEQRKPKAPL